MKKIFSIVFAGMALATLVGCSDASFDEKYTDPSKTSTVGVPQVFTGIISAGNTWMNPVYYRYYTQSTTSGTFSGIIGTANGRGRYRGASEGYYDTRWKNFYNMKTQFNLLEENFKPLEGEEKAANAVFYYLGRTLVEAQLHEVLSLWGDVPFNGTGTLWIDSDYERAKNASVYEDDVVLYKQILADLKEVGDKFASGELSNATGLASLKRQDITLAGGSADLWQRYVNSLRLRIALHLATNGDCVADAKAAIAEILNNPTKYPVIEENGQNQGVAANTSTDTFNYGKSFSQALHTGSYATVGQAVLDALHINANGEADENSDPRVASMLDPNPDNQYVSYDVTLTDTEISNIADAKNKEYVEKQMTANYWAQVDSVALQGKQTYDGNANLDGLWVGAAEVALSKAEAYLMGYGVSADANKAKECFVQGVKLSTEYYANLKTKSSFYSEGTDDIAATRPYVAPTAADAEAYANAIWTPSQECVCTQLWLNHFVMNELEAWNVTRRTGFPSVKFATDTQVSTYPTPPHRLPYVADELSYNKANVQEAIDKNYKESTGYYTPLFWAKENYFNKVK